MAAAPPKKELIMGKEGVRWTYNTIPTLIKSRPTSNKIAPANRQRTAGRRLVASMNEREAQKASSVTFPTLA